ncbi:uncharacterized protein BX664DRAFT_335994 [Halteromyces radiatus]|uniref:uncharacterized protein n=1 Tax=Halteromyces radiatus TaxID=101107 RepID=UPI002220C53B|nr:uncharacterized protein BX664DRAFT_335994 [Halteromyces radiatus]KAI8086510.1 hypothetical protein BX664DRAFT_335994 [Halteromyces radiatus]
MKSISKYKQWLKNLTLDSNSNNITNNTTHSISTPSLTTTLSTRTTSISSNDWRTLSPDQPPLPTLFSHSEATTVTPGAGLAPMFEHRPFAFTPLTTALQNQQHHYRHSPFLSDTCSRPLDPILEENESSEIMTSKVSTNNDSALNTNIPSPISSTSSSAYPSVQTKSKSEHEPSSSRPETQQQEPQRTSTSSNSSNGSVVSCGSPPLTINTIWHHQRQSSDEIGSSSPMIGNELQCKRKFSKMVQATYRFQSKTNIPSYMQAIFEKDQVHGIRLILSNGQQSHCPFTGNPQYIPPEMFIRQSCSGGLSDVWVLGISLYRMLVGNYPFKATDDRKLVSKMLHADFSIPDHLSEDVKDLLRRMLAPEQSRASLDLVMFHPWLKPYRIVISTASSSVPSPRISLRINKKKRKPKWQRIINKTFRFLFLGPYPPPTRPYRELAHLGK